MSEDRANHPANDQDLPIRELLEAAMLAASNLGTNEALFDLSPEHWQIVLANVEAKMRMRSITPPDGWQAKLARRVGRTS